MGQELAVYAIVALAALNLARIWGGSIKGSGCGKCGGCDSKSKAGAKAAPQAPQLVQLQMNLKSKE